MSTCSVPGVGKMSHVFLPRELHRYHNVGLDSFKITTSEMGGHVESLTSDWELPWLNIAWTEEECSKYSKPFSQLLDEKRIQMGIKTQTWLPWRISTEGFDLHFAWRNNARTSVELNIFPGLGAGDSAVDVCMVMRRLIILGLNDYHQPPLTKAETDNDIPREFPRQTINLDKAADLRFSRFWQCCFVTTSRKGLKSLGKLRSFETMAYLEICKPPIYEDIPLLFKKEMCGQHNTMQKSSPRRSLQFLVIGTARWGQRPSAVVWDREPSEC